MNREQIIRMAKNEYGIYAFTAESLAELAVIIATAEREACAKVCEGLGVHPALNIFNGGPEWYKHGKDCAAAIRARGEK